MICEHIELGGGATAIICRSGKPSKRCEFCGKLATKQCDFPVERNGKQGTCDKYMCDGCATPQTKALDYCPPHERNKLKIMEARLKTKRTSPIAVNEKRGPDHQRS